MIEKEQMRGDIPGFKTGDTIKVHVRIIEGQKQRIQAFEEWSFAKKLQQPCKFYREKSVLRCGRGKNLSAALAGH